MTEDRLASEAQDRSGALARTILFLFSVALPLDVIPISGTSSITFLTGILLAAAGVWQIVSTGLVRSGTGALWMLTAYTAWALASVLWAHDTEAALTRFTTNVQLLAFVWLGWQIARSRRDLALMASGYVIGCTVACAGAWRSFLSGVTYYEQNPVFAQRYSDSRYAAMGYDPNDMGLTVALAIPLASYLALSAKGSKSYLWLGYLPIALSVVGLSGSRGAMMAAAVALVWVMFWIGRRSQVAAVAVFAALFGALSTVAVRSPDTLDRFFTIRQQLASGTFSDRRNIWAAGFRTFLEHPIFGLGTGQFSAGVAPELGYAIEAHNAFVSVLVELGVVGILLYAGAFVVAGLGSLRNERNERMLALGLLATWFMGVSSLTWELRKASWFVLLVAILIGHLARREPDQATADAPEAAG